MPKTEVPQEMTGDGDLFPQRWVFGVTDEEVLILIAGLGALLAVNYQGMSADEFPDDEPAFTLLKRLLTHRDGRKASDDRFEEEINAG